MRQKILQYIVVCIMTGVMLIGCGNNEEGKKESSSIERTSANDFNNTELLDQSNESETSKLTETSTTESTEELITTETKISESTETTTPTLEMPETSTSTVESTEIPKHTHNYIEAVITEALCNTTGVKQYSCSCGDSYQEEYIDTHNHQPDGNPRVLKESDCIHRGIYGEVCLHCGLYVNSKTLELIDHIPASYWVYFSEEIAATMLNVEAGYYLGCANCNYTIEFTTVRPEGAEIKEATPYYFD